ncbi:MAG TPA: hypothetical protein VH280_14785 [Verrucomicrobiae bacterium]|nr:hypothetical protein [Verrucomicrobiae bacterium]
MTAATATVRRLAVLALDAIAKTVAVLAMPGAVGQDVADLAMELLPNFFGLGFHVQDAWRHRRPRTWNGGYDSTVAQQ